MCTPVERRKNNSLDMNSSSRAINNTVSGILQNSRSSRHKWSVTGSQSRRSSIMVGGSRSKVGSLDKTSCQAPRKVRVLDNDGTDVTPLFLYHPEPEVKQSKSRRFFLDKIFSSSGSNYLKSTSCFSFPSSSSFLGSSISSRSTDVSLTKRTKDSFPKLDTPIQPLAPCEEEQEDGMKQHVTDKMLDEVVDIYLTETETISLLDIPPIFVSENAEDAQDIKERNIDYAELCKNRMGNDKYVVRSMQTLAGALKEEQIQVDEIVMVDKGTIATNWNIYDSFSALMKTSENETDYPESDVNTNRGQEKRGEQSRSSTVCSGSTIVSVLEMEMCGNTECDPQLIMLSESFKHSLLVMERSIVGNIFQPKLAAYRHLSILQDPDSTWMPGAEEQTEEGEESSLSPSLRYLWAFSFESTKRCNVLTWNRKNPDILAAGYGDYDSNGQTPSLICCWSLKNPTWPERVFHCRSCVTSLDFSASKPGLLAVGMFDGTVAIYNVRSQNKNSCIADSSECKKKHLHPVWQVRWAKQEIGSGEDRAEALVSVSTDGRIAKWTLRSSGLDCDELMKLKRPEKKEKKKEKESGRSGMNLLSAMAPGLCIDPHPTDFGIYLVGTWDGLIHKCSLFNKENFLDTYKNHISPVNRIEWSPFNSDVFLSCSSDWNIHLWKQDHFSPVMSFTSNQTAVYTVRWSPNCSTIFAALNEEQVEIWDLNSSIGHPTIVLHAAPGVKMMSLLLTRGTDCVLVGDSDGKVNVYQLKNLSTGRDKQVKVQWEVNVDLKVTNDVVFSFWFSSFTASGFEFVHHFTPMTVFTVINISFQS